MRFLTFLLVCAMGAAPLHAANVRMCDTFEANARNLSYPYEEATKTYADGAISLISLMLDEPACCGAHLMVLFPAPDEGFLDCRLISREAQLGYSGLSVIGASASYDPAVGLQITVPTEVYTGEGTDAGLLELTVNQARGTVEARDR